MNLTKTIFPGSWVLLILAIFFQCNTLAKDGPLINNGIPLRQLIDSLHIERPTLSLFVDKSDHTLSVMSGDVIVKQYPVVFGGNPNDDKLREGDQCTPEGNFKVRDFYPHKSWSKFIWIDYPTDDSWAKHRKAKEEGKIAKNASIGGEIGIHGVPKGYESAIPMRINWTLGCVSLKNKDVDEIYDFVFKGMEIKIQR